MNELALIRYARQVLGTPFAWGRVDCALVGLAALDAARGTALAAQYLGRWHDMASALRHFRQELPSQVLARHGLRPIAPARAAVGDLVLVPAAPFPEAVHVVLGRRCLTADPQHGACLVRLAELLPRATSAWRAA